MKNPDPEKFTMEVAHGVKAEADPNAPDIAVPFCKAHRTWPCRHCGTSHFEGCTCPVCVAPDNEKLKAQHVREQMADALTLIGELRRLLKQLSDDLKP